jgi:hypothetical protein
MSETESTEITESTESTEIAGTAVLSVEPVEPVEPVASVASAAPAAPAAPAPAPVWAGIATAPESEPESELQPKPKRRIRGTTLLTAAIVLGVLGGVATGYVVQWMRPATPLPSLAGSQPAYKPAGVYQGVAPAMLPASQDDATITDGDLTKLLLPVPSGASTDDSLWLDQLVDPEEVAQLCTTDEASCLTNDYSQGVEAIADTNWTQDGFHVEIRIYRMARGQSSTARSWASNDTDSANQIPMPTGIDSSGYEFRDSYGDNDDNAYAAHGDIVVEFWVSSPTKTPNPSMIDGLITQQMGRL